nr:PREDICTED: ER lumen protein-retaining receptor 3 [Equus przewalskii]
MRDVSVRGSRVKGIWELSRLPLRLFSKPRITQNKQLKKKEAKAGQEIAWKCPGQGVVIKCDWTLYGPFELRLGAPRGCVGLAVGVLIVFYPHLAIGISGKSQILFALVFTTRYLDLFTNFISIYNTVMKVVFLLCAYVTVYMIYGKFRKTFDSENDTFRLEFLLVPVIGLSFLENYNFTPLEILWTFSIYLESVAILPQLFMISKTGEAETITTHYLFFLGLYRALYLANWIRRYQTENFYDQIAVVSGVVQTIFYCDFFYLYVTKVLKGKKLSLPMPI